MISLVGVIISLEAQHKTIKLYNANMKKAIKEKSATKAQIDLYNIRQEKKDKNILGNHVCYIIMDKKFKWMQHLQYGITKKQKHYI